MNNLIKSMCIMWLSVGLFAGCEEKKAVDTSKEEDPVAEAPEKTGEAAADKKEDGKIEVTAAGAKIDPPVAKDKIPAGAWYCDMGTVHYARMDKGDGKCPECGMMLKQMAADGTAPGGAVAADGGDAKASDCACAKGEKCEACAKAGEECTCGTDKPCESCGCGEAKKDGAAEHAGCNHPEGEACDCGGHGEKKEDGHGAHEGHEGHKH